MEICFEGIGQTVATFQTEEELEAGMAVTITESGTVGLGEPGALLCGVTAGKAREGWVAVQIGGAAKTACSGQESVKAGYNTLACDGMGGVSAVKSGGMSCLVLDVDQDQKNVVVRL